MRKISSIDKNGKVLFVDDKGTGTTVGTKEDCLTYGYNYTGSTCYIQNNNKPIQTKGNTNLDKANKIRGGNNNVLGKGNSIQAKNTTALGNNNKAYFGADNSTLIGRNAYSVNYGEMAYSCAIDPDRSKFSILQYLGTTTNNVATEIYLGGKDGYRFFINEGYESAMYIEAKCVCLDVVNNDAVLRSKILLYKYAGSTLTEIFDTDYVNAGDSSLSAVALNFAPVASTPDYIEVKVTGLAGTRLDWNLTITLTEVKNA